MFKALKDSIASNAALLHCNRLISRYGALKELRIDSARRRMEAVFHLEGETAPVAVTVEKYEIVEEKGRKFFRVVECRCARPWIQNVIEDHVYGRKFPLPHWAAAIL